MNKSARDSRDNAHLKLNFILHSKLNMKKLFMRFAYSRVKSSLYEHHPTVWRCSRRI